LPFKNLTIAFADGLVKMRSLYGFDGILVGASLRRHLHVLLSGSMELVREDARRRIATGKPGGGYILSTACSIAPRTPRENVCVLAEAAEAGGVY
jgi:hypothetical protein